MAIQYPDNLAKQAAYEQWQKENKYQFVLIERATKKYPKRYQVAAEGTKEEMDRVAKQYSEDPAYRSDPKGVRQKPFEYVDAPIRREHGYELVGEPLTASQEDARRAARPEVQQRRAENLEKNRQLAEANRAIQQAKTTGARQAAIQQRNIISAKAPSQVYTEKQERQRIETAPGGLLVTPARETLKDVYARTPPPTRSQRAAETLKKVGFAVTPTDTGIIAARGGQYYELGDVAGSFVKSESRPLGQARFQRGFEEGLSPKASEPTSADVIMSNLFRRQGREVSVDERGLVSVQPTEGIAGGARGIQTKSYGFEEYLGTGKSPFYAKGLLGKGYVFGKEIGAKYKKWTDSGDRYTFRDVYEKKISPPLIKPLGKVEEKLFTAGTFFYGRASKPSDVSLPSKIQKQGKPYDTYKISDSYILKPFHKSIEKAQEFKNLAKRGGYLALGAGTDIARMTLGVGKYAVEKPWMVPVWVYGFKGASRLIGSKLTTGTFVVGSALTAPSGQRLRTAVGVAGTFGLLSLGAKGVSALKQTPGEIRSVLERRRAVPRIIDEAVGKPYKQKPGLQATQRIQEAIIRDKPIPGLERIQAEEIIGTPKKGITYAREPSPGADFKGIARVTPKEPEPIIKKGNILFKELGIEEAGILKAEPKSTKKRVLSFAGVTLEQFQPVTTLGITTRAGRGQSIISYIKGQGIQFGTPNLRTYLERLPRGEEIKVAGALETRAYIRALRGIEGKELYNIARARESLPIMQRILRRTRTTKSRFIKKLPKETERLSEQGVKIAKDIAKEYQGTIFGGFSREAQLAETIYRKGLPFERLPRLRDIDIRFDTAGEVQLKAITQESLLRLRKAGIKAREVKDIPFAIEVKQPTSRFEKAIEFKGKEDIIEGEEVPEFVLGFRKVGKPIRISKQKVTPLSEELRGVAQGVARIRKVTGKLDIFPPSKRTKDIGSVVVSARTLLQSKRFFRKGLEKDIERFESIYPKKLIEEQLKKPQKIPLADYTPSPKQARITYPYLPPSPRDILPPSPFKIRSPASRRYRSISKSISKSSIPSRTPSMSKSFSRSFYKPVSKTPSRTPSKSISRSFSKSISRSLSIPKSPSLSKSFSRSFSKSVSRSRSLSRSISKSITPSRVPSISKFPFYFPKREKIVYKKKKPLGFSYFYREFKFPDLSKVL